MMTGTADGDAGPPIIRCCPELSNVLEFESQFFASGRWNMFRTTPAFSTQLIRNVLLVRHSIVVFRPQRSRNYLESKKYLQANRSGQ
jgi:hypothetical protein